MKTQGLLYVGFEFARVNGIGFSLASYICATTAAMKGEDPSHLLTFFSLFPSF
jgi:hypothetical protein